MSHGRPDEASTKLNWGERLAVNTPVRVLQQRLEIYWMVKACAPGSFAHVLEVGCGRGAGARLILKAFKPLDLFATDLDIEMMQKAARYLSLDERQTIHLCAADLLKLPYGNRSMDALFGFGVLHHIVDWRAALSEISRVLKPNALYFIEELYPSLYQNWLTKRFLLHPTRDRFTGPDLKEALRQAGLSLIAARELRKIGILAVARKTTLSPSGT